MSFANLKSPTPYSSKLYQKEEQPKDRGGQSPFYENLWRNPSLVSYVF